GHAAAIREAGQRAGDDAGAGAIAGRDVREQVAGRRAGRRHARRPGHPLLTGARLALAVGAAHRGVGHLALTGRVNQARGDVGADARRPRDARLARAVAGLVAADALRAELRAALGWIRARRPRLFQAARVAEAGVGRHALAVHGAGVEAAGGVADVRAARDQWRRLALAGGVAGRRRLVDVA